MKTQTLSNRKNFVKTKQFERKKQMGFLPEGYKTPEGASRYMKLKEGENKIRILSKPVMGYEMWEDKVPKRYREEKDCPPSRDSENKPKHFWAFLVWNYDEEKVQILSVTQVTLQKAIESLSNDEDWGAPFFYDLKIHKSGNTKQTKYSVNPLPHKPLHGFIETEFHASPCNLEALFTNEDPFAAHWKKHTEGIFENEESAVG